MSSDYKLLREDFIRGHNGSTASEVVAITCVNQLANLLLIAVLSLFPVLTEPNHLWIRYSIEFFIIMTPFITCITILSDYIFFVYLAIISLTVIAIVLCFMRRQTKQIVVKDLLELCPNYEQRLPFLTNLFSTLMQCVCIAILAVDFRVFSRRFAKTEIYGFSLMDVGVGSFIAINGGFSPESRLGSDSRNKRMFLFKKTVFSTVPLIVLGFQRLIAVKSLEYHEHVTEYGVHWNFFFTLGLSKICLNCGLSEFIQNDNRNGLFAANKEGILSLFGYISLYLIFVEIGKYIVNLNDTYIESTSRREMNLSFVFWMVSLNSLFIGMEFAIQTLVHCLQHLNVLGSGDTHRSIIFSAIGYSGMLLFLVSNLLTGLINFTINTISVSNSIAFAIIVIYSLILSIISVILFHYKIQIKIPVKQKSD
ncbi:unnamed protein product, partial [Medioppia subpectinata]